MFEDFSVQFKGFAQCAMNDPVKLGAITNPITEITGKDKFFLNYIHDMVKECQKKLMKEFLLDNDRHPEEVVATYFILMFEIGMIIGAASREKELKS